LSAKRSAEHQTPRGEEEPSGGGGGGSLFRKGFFWYGSVLFPGGKRSVFILKRREGSGYSTKSLSGGRGRTRKKKNPLIEIRKRVA